MYFYRIFQLFKKKTYKLQKKMQIHKKKSSLFPFLQFGFKYKAVILLKKKLQYISVAPALH